MIVTSARRQLAGAPPTGGGWVSLARRGMLWSEVQVFDIVAIGPGVAGFATDPDYLEVLYCAAGSARVSGAAAPVPFETGCCLVHPPGPEVLTVAGGPVGATVVRVRMLPEATSRALPARWPSLVPPAPAGPPPAPGGAG